ncbi:ABC transporter permease [Roseinatronobacter bogoriensis]|uniref:ABC transporter permease n=1 Tax=Roseinatronobacter bogoriensis subsp. barguzinensis TaxID=441209 RepID=A0A2K8K4X8_9RHOB|nr:MULTISPECIES: ABC transporter permease [Rhodobaca]ATX64514.1 ABC transporter permease [Rhodobaca barguzinensis]MBB4209229.1 peptide/nickel transport system permease protein [Rhodobaca bogoriensis DSM 18756]TDW36245.1 peptide/nickel transport system permease protein [Rhodobaca barguzinensis]TDY67627.1 peptide/nickel transport system permease protein [Rhodobaca bogoriensis DSM 18756]
MTTATYTRARMSYGFLLTPKAIFGLIMIGALIIAGAFAPFIAPFNPARQDLLMAMTPPQLTGPHYLGTDHVGRDLLSRLIYGARVSLLIAIAVVFFSGIVGVFLGIVSGYFGGRIDSFIQKFLEVFWAFPPLLLAIAIVAFLGQSLTIVIVALASQRWIPYCRLARAETMALRDREFVVAARSLGAGHARILREHILPNIIPSTLVVGTFAMATAIISEAALSFLGLGVPPSIPTWGGMLADARAYISTSWWMALFPGLCIFLTVLGINLLGDVLRSHFDPKIKNF